MFSPLVFPRDGANIFFALTFVPPPRVSLAPIDCALLMFHCESIKFETGLRLKLRLTFHSDGSEACNFREFPMLRSEANRLMIWPTVA